MSKCVSRHTNHHYFSTAEVYKRLGILCCLHIDAKNHPSLRATFKKKKYVCFLLFSKSNSFIINFRLAGKNKYDRITLSEYKTAIVIDVFVWKCINYTYVTLGHCLSTLTLMFIVIYAMYYLNRVTMMMIYYYFDKYNKLLILLREINSWDKVILLRYSLLVLSPPPLGN